MVAKRGLSREVADAVAAFRSATGIERVIVFGSQARGEATAGSDVDLLIVDARFEGVKMYRRALGLRQHWPKHLPVDFLCYTPLEFEALRVRPTLVRSAVEEGVST